MWNKGNNFTFLCFFDYVNDHQFLGKFLPPTGDPRIGVHWLQNNRKVGRTRREICEILLKCWDGQILIKFPISKFVFMIIRSFIWEVTTINPPIVWFNEILVMLNTVPRRRIFLWWIQVQRILLKYTVFITINIENIPKFSYKT